MISVAAEHAEKGAGILRKAILARDPYARADAVWEAARRARCAAEQLHGRAAERCEDIAHQLEGCCEAGRPTPPDDFLETYVEALEAI
jgi:hypothetical protein